MRIAMVTGSSYPPTEGIGIYSLSLARELVRLGHSVAIMTRGTVRMSRAEADGVDLVSLPFIPIYPFHVHIWGYIANQYLERAKDRFEIFHAHSPLVPVLSKVRPVVTTLHSPLSEHVSEIDDARSLLTSLQLLVSRRLEYKLLLRSQAIAVVNPLLRRSLEKRLGGRVPVRALANGVDAGRYVPDPKLRDANLVVAVGRLQHGKGFDDLLAAWPHVLQRHAGAKLEIVGDGPLRGRLRATAERLGIHGSVRFAGAVSPTESDALLRTYQRAALVVQPSHHEGLSTVLLEALATGSPVVATNVGGHPAVIDQGVQGILVEPRNPDALSLAISEVLASNDASEMGARGREKIVSSYTWERIAQGYEAWYETVLST